MANFPGLLLTTDGRDLQAKAQIGAALTFSRVALGDGTSTAPDAMSVLSNERLSLSIQEFEVVGDGTSRMRVIMTNESLSSGFFVRELGVFAIDPDTGDERLYSYTNAGEQPDFLPAGGGATLVENVFDLYTVVGNAQNVTAQINNYITIATKADIDEIRPLLLPAGGTTGQMARKVSNNDGDVEWFDPAADINIAVNSVEERRIAVAGQRTFRLVIVTTQALAVYLNGQRLPRSQWEPLGETQVRFVDTLSAGDEVLFVKNEEVGEIEIPRVSLTGPDLVYPGSSNTYTITDYDSFAEYAVTASTGTVGRSGNTITLDIDPGAPSGGLDLNVTRGSAGVTYPLAVGEQTIAAPAMTSPANNDTGVALRPTLQLTPFVTYPAGADTQASADYQIARDVDFTDIVWQSMGDTQNLEAVTPGEPLPINTQLYGRGRQNGTALGASAWTPTVAFTTTDQYIVTPSIVAPPDGALDVPEQPVFESTAFETYPAGADTHKASSWWFYDNLGEIIWQSLNDTSNLTSITMPAGRLKEGGKAYTAEVQHHGRVLNDSSVSAPSSVTTEETFVPEGQPGAPFGGGYYTETMWESDNQGGRRYALVVSPKADGEPNDFRRWQSAKDFCTNLVLNGKNDWDLPTVDEARIIYRRLRPKSVINNTSYGATKNVSPPVGNYLANDPPQTAVNAFKGGGSEAFEADFHWTSTSINSNYAWDVNFSDGYEVSRTKAGFAHTRAVRRVYF